MLKVTVPSRIYLLIEAKASMGELDERGTVWNEDGTVTFSLSEETAARLEARFPAHTPAEAIERLVMSIQ